MEEGSFFFGLAAASIFQKIKYLSYVLIFLLAIFKIIKWAPTLIFYLFIKVFNLHFFSNATNVHCKSFKF